MKTETDIQISSLRARLKDKVIGSDDPDMTPSAECSSLASTVGPRPSSASATHRTSRVW